MRSRHWIIAIVTLSTGFSACGADTQARSCGPCVAPGETSIHVVTNGNRVRSLAFSGNACAGASITSTLDPSTGRGSSSATFEDNALEYRIEPIVAGVCKLELTLGTGDVLTRDVGISVRYLGAGTCCPIYESNANEWDLPPATADAG